VGEGKDKTLTHPLTLTPSLTPPSPSHTPHLHPYPPSPLFVDEQCTTLIEDNKVIWSPDTIIKNHREFDVEKDSTRSLMAIHIGSGQYQFQAL